MRKYELFTGEKTYLFPNSAIGDRDAFLRDFPGALLYPHLVGTDDGGQVCFEFLNYASACAQRGIDPTTPVDIGISLLEEIVNAPPEEELRPITAEERIAAALELQNAIATDWVVAPSAEIIRANVLNGLWGGQVLEVAAQKQAIDSAMKALIQAELSTMSGGAEVVRS